MKQGVKNMLHCVLLTVFDSVAVISVTVLGVDGDDDDFAVCSLSDCEEADALDVAGNDENVDVTCTWLCSTDTWVTVSEPSEGEDSMMTCRER